MIFSAGPRGSDPIEEREGTEGSDSAEKTRSRRTLIGRAVLIMVPILATLVFIILLFLFLESAVFNIMIGAMLGYSISPLGPELVIPIGVGFLYDAGAASLTFLLVFSVVFIDIILALFILLNFELIEGAPLVGRWVKKSEEILSKRLKRGKEKLALSMLVLYVALPFQGSGGFVGSLMGRLVGLNRYKVFSAVAFGSVLGAVPIGIASYYGVTTVIDALKAGESIYGIIGILILAIFIILLVYVIRKETKKRRARRMENEISDKAEEDVGR